MLKWCEVGPEKTLRYDVLHQFLKRNSIDQEFQFVECQVSELKSSLKDLEKTFDVIRIHPTYTYEVSQIIDHSFQELIRVGTVDTLLKNKNNFWPQSFLREAIFQFLTTKMKNIDTSQEVLIIGSCGLARAIAAAIVRLGFSKLNFISEDEKKDIQLVSDFKKIFFNTQFKITPKDQLTLLPGVHGVVCNTFSFQKSDDFLSDLYFFNFLKKGGWVLDFSDVPVESPMIHVASDVGAQTLVGHEINSFFDILWVEKVFGKKMDYKVYCDEVRIELDKASFDKEKYQKILSEFQM